jgi:hypothetical protein
VRSVVGAVVQVLMCSDIPAAEAFFRDHLRVSPTGHRFRRPTTVGRDGAGLEEGALMDRKPFNF